MLSLSIRSSLHIKKVAALLAGALEPPQIIFLQGELGAGKTTFVKGFIQGLSAPTLIRVQSPTFSLVRTYASVPLVHHMDLYRLDASPFLDNLGLDYFLHDEKAFCLIEWPMPLLAYYASRALQIHFHIKTLRTRKLDFIFPSTMNPKLISQLKETLGASLLITAPVA